jgi:hypothetical protein
MSKVRDISNLSNVIRTDASGNVSFVSGSTTLATLNTSGQLSGSSPVLSSSYALNATSASYAVSASNATNAVTASYANAFTVANTLTAQTLVVQTVTSSVIYSSGSNIFGNNIANTQVFTGSVLISSGSYFNIGRGADYSYPLNVTSPYAKTDTTGRGLMFIGSNEAIASNPFGLVVTVTGAASIANRYINLGTTDFGLANGGNLVLQSSGGNVGIGLTNPSSIFQVASAQSLAVIRSTTTTNYAELQVENTTNYLQIGVEGATGNRMGGTIAYNSYLGSYTNYGMTFHTNNLNRMTITSAGLVGIGINTPNARLDLGSSYGASGEKFLIYNDNTSSALAGTKSGFYLDRFGLSNNTTYVFATYPGYDGSFIIASKNTGDTTLINRLTVRGESGNLGVGAQSPRTRLQVTPTSNAETPVLGTATGAVTFTSANTNYGIQFNSTSDGSYYIQSQRFDASATAYALGLNPAGGVVYLGPGFGATNHRIDLPVSEGGNVLVVSGYAGSSNDSAIFYGSSGTSGNAAASTMWMSKNSSTSRSISAGGTINASGADYAEYMTKAIEDTINKGDIVGVNSDGKLTNIFADAISFVVKSTDPSYVGGDTWFNEEKRPSRTTDQTEEEFTPILADFEARLEVERAKVDRIAFSGQVPCNVTGANVGDYIIPIQLENGKIGGQAVTNPTFEQYQISVGKVWKIMENEKAWIAVKIG